MVLGGPLPTLSEEGETKLQGQDTARTEGERDCTWRGQHTGTSVETGELHPAHASVNRIVEIIQLRLPLQKPPVWKRQRWTSHHAARLGWREGPAARMPGWEAGKASWRRGFSSYSFEG